MAIINIIGASKISLFKSVIIILSLLLPTIVQAKEAINSDLAVCSDFERISNKNRQIVEKKMKQLMDKYPLPKNRRLSTEEALNVFF